MSILNSVPQNRAEIDLNLSNATAIGTAGSTVQSAAFDTGDNVDGYFPEHVELQILVPPCPNLAAPGVATSLTFTVLADVAATPTLAIPLSFTVAGTSGTGSVAVTKNFRVPGGASRYIAVQVAAGANAGNNSAVSFTTQFAF